MEGRLLPCLLALALLSSCGEGASFSAPPRASPKPSAAPLVRRSIPSKFPMLVAENERWSVYLDDWTWKEETSTLDFSVYAASGEWLQDLEMETPYPNGIGYSGLVFFEDLNFDGIPDLKVLWGRARNEAFDAFLWDEKLGAFVEEPTYTEITGPCGYNAEEKLVFGCGSSSAVSCGWSAFRYVEGAGYQLEYSLSVNSGDAEDPGKMVETRYENGEAVNVIETYDHADLSDIWDKREYPEG